MRCLAVYDIPNDAARTKIADFCLLAGPLVTPHLQATLGLRSA